MRKFFLACAMLSVLAVSSSATPVLLIDHFSSGPFIEGDPPISPFKFVSGSRSKVQPGLAGVIGAWGLPPGERDVTVNITTSTGNSFVFGVGGHQFGFACPSGGVANAVISYGNYTVGQGDLNANVSGSLFMGFEVTFADQGGSYQIDLMCNTSVHYTMGPFSIPAGGAFFSPAFSDSGIPDGLNGLADVDGIKFTFFSSNNAWDFQIDEIGFATPEPATISLLGLGILALVRRRRRTG